MAKIQGEYIRDGSYFRNWITSDGSSGFPAEKNRYHLYVSLACPWAHRTLIVRRLKGLEHVISVDIVDPSLDKDGWKFSGTIPPSTLDTVNNCNFLSEIYHLSNPNYTGKWTVPVLFDRVSKKIVNNESSEIIRMFNTEFNDFCATEEQKQLDIYPEEFRSKIDELNSWIYSSINNGVYQCGFSKSQEAYDSAVRKLFKGLDKVEEILSKSRYLVGGHLTEADLRLFPTLIRFDHVYHGHFKCNKKRIIDYPNIWAYTRDLYQTADIGGTVNLEQIKLLYEKSQTSINPYGIVSIGPDIDFSSPHDRDRFGKK